MGVLGVVVVFQDHTTETDSSEALKLIQHDDNLEGLPAIVWCIKEFCRRGWSISYLHVPRNGNRVVDALTTMINTDSLELIALEEPPVYVVHLLHEDLISTSIPI
ncbi:hypothetical protein V6N12_024640 [Hibiscus sabdariffa]|uniref:RNase H type-1 domain-containing protein n=1 Tax=Hibiscus sabdariffa TaxID=183260 RepID=A0ABR2G1V2_9ROSI